VAPVSSAVRPESSIPQPKLPAGLPRGFWDEAANWKLNICVS
jgi:hypothetical protein